MSEFDSIGPGYNESMIGFLSVIYRRAQMFLDRELKSLNIRAGQVPIMVILDRENGISQDRIKNILHVDKGTVAKTIKPLITEGYVEREINPEDRRAYCIALTDKGRSVMPVITEHLEQWMGIMMEGFSTEENDQVFGFLHRMSGSAFGFIENERNKSEE